MSNEWLSSFRVVCLKWVKPLYIASKLLSGNFSFFSKSFAFSQAFSVLCAVRCVHNKNDLTSFVTANRTWKAITVELSSERKSDFAKLKKKEKQSVPVKSAMKMVKNTTISTSNWNKSKIKYKNRSESWLKWNWKRSASRVTEITQKIEQAEKNTRENEPKRWCAEEKQERNYIKLSECRENWIHLF